MYKVKDFIKWALTHVKPYSEHHENDRTAYQVEKIYTFDDIPDSITVVVDFKPASAQEP